MRLPAYSQMPSIYDLHLVCLQQAKAGAVAATDPQEPDGGGDHVPALELRRHHR